MPARYRPEGNLAGDCCEFYCSVHVYWLCRCSRKKYKGENSVDVLQASSEQLLSLNDSLSLSKHIWCHSLIATRLRLCSDGHLSWLSIKPHTHQLAFCMQQWAMRGLKTDRARTHTLKWKHLQSSSNPCRTRSRSPKKHRALKCCIYSVSHAPSFMRDSPETAAPVNRESDAPRCFKVRLRLRVRRRRACCWLWCADGSAVPLILKREKSGGSVRRAASEKHSTGKKQSWGANIRQQCCSSGWRDGESDCCWETRRETRRRRRASLYWIVEEGDGRQKGEGLKHIQCLEERERPSLFLIFFYHYLICNNCRFILLLYFSIALCVCKCACMMFLQCICVFVNSDASQTQRKNRY